MNDIALRARVLKPDISLHLNTGKMTRKFAWCKGSAAYTDLAAESGTSETTGPGWQQVRGPARWDRGRKLGRREIVLSWESLSARCLSLRAWSMIKNVHHAACCSLLASGTKQQAFKPLFSRKHPDRATPDTRRGGFVKLPGNKTWVFTLRFRCRGLLFACTTYYVVCYSSCWPGPGEECAQCPLVCGDLGLVSRCWCSVARRRLTRSGEPRHIDLSPDDVNKEIVLASFY